MMFNSIQACLLMKKSHTLSAKYTNWLEVPPGPEILMKAGPAKSSPELSATDIFNLCLRRSVFQMPILLAIVVPATHIPLNQTLWFVSFA